MAAPSGSAGVSDPGAAEQSVINGSRLGGHVDVTRGETERCAGPAAPDRRNRSGTSPEIPSADSPGRPVLRPLSPGHVLGVQRLVGNAATMAMVSRLARPPRPPASKRSGPAPGPSGSGAGTPSADRAADPTVAAPEPTAGASGAPTTTSTGPPPGAPAPTTSTDPPAGAPTTTSAGPGQGGPLRFLAPAPVPTGLDRGTTGTTERSRCAGTGRGRARRAGWWHYR